MTLICLIGPSGSGKTTLAEMLVPMGIDTIRSYTTRPMRPGERQGREHIFITDDDAQRLLLHRRPLAYTHFGGYRYFALWEQLKTPSVPLEGGGPEAATTHASSPFKGDMRGSTYVIDEAGYHTLRRQLFDTLDQMQLDYGYTLPYIRLVPIRIERPDTHDIDPDRLARDRDRLDDGICYPIRIINDAPDSEAYYRWCDNFGTALRIVSIMRIDELMRDDITIELHTADPSPAHIIARINGAL